MTNQITTKELSGVEDILSHFAVAIKKAAYYKDICSDKKIKKICDDLLNRNKVNFQDLLEHLN